ncbi:hypothetical protein EXIGLDRAFT_717977 [Exidia glandulosa HHB12029]|uniref:RNA polymerase II-associated protein 3 n=1 Tax=Exidia glandulosa HHB12029 TaxID=1314781 RepID=A0A165P3F2_EXIGL|nr:hypothetical protein EXIGLDRAFT_717977 [Exidia glandulosa HHB12029]
MSGAAKAAKDKGNAAFKSGDFVAAVGHYTDAALADRLEPTYPLNRAAAYLKLGKYADAERDCSTTLALSHGNVKALYRRAQARIALRKLDDAEKDLNDALKREPANDAVKQELVKLKQIRAEASAPKKAPISVSTPLPAATASSATTKPIRRRIPIKIVDDDAPASIATHASTSASKAGEDFMTPVATRSLSGSSSSSTPPPKSILKKPQPTEPTQPPSQTPATSFQAAKDARDQARKPKVGGGIFKANGTHTLFKGSTTAQEEATPRIVEVTAPEPAPAPPAPRTRQLPLPQSPDTALTTTLFNLQREWRNRPTAEARWELLCSVPPSSLPKLCGTSLEPAFLVAVLDTFRTLAVSGVAQADARNAMRDYLNSFATVPRFDTVLMFLSAQEKEVVRDTIRSLGLKSWAGVS